MPRAKKQQLPFTFEAPSITLSSGVRSELLNLLGMEAEGELTQQAIAKIESVVSMYSGGQHVIDHPPWTVDVAKTFILLKRDAEKLSQALEDLGPFYRDLLANGGENFTHTCEVLRGLAQIIGKLADNSPGARRGAPQNAALREAVGKLRGVFFDYAQGTRTKKQEHAFLKAALLRTNIRRLAISAPDRPEEDISSQFDKSLKGWMEDALPAGSSAAAKAAASDQIARKITADRKRI